MSSEGGAGGSEHDTPTGQGRAAGRPEDPALSPVDGSQTLEDAGHDRAGTPRRSHLVRQVLEWVAIVGVAVALALLVRTFVVQTYYIPSGSMEPTLQVGDRILVIKLAYRVVSPARGDVVVFHAPSDEASQCGSVPVADLVKRIIGVPGDEVSSRGNFILINGQVLHQNWPHTAQLGARIVPTYLKPGQYFMLGDNHTQSCDSRVWGPIRGSAIIGKAVLVFWPLRDFHRI